jgi:hypothetical protein
VTDNRIPIDQAVKQVAAQTGLPESKIREYARALQNRGKSIASGAGFGISPAMHAVILQAAQDEVDKARALAQRGDLGGVVLALKRIEQLRNPRPWIQPTAPANPHDRRTIRIAGKPYHFAQGKGALRLQPGETPWE